jgi:hypothetical protein
MKKDIKVIMAITSTTVMGADRGQICV